MLNLTDAARATSLFERRGLVQPHTSTSEGFSELVSWRKEAHLIDDARLLRRLCVDKLDFEEVCASFAGNVPTLDSSPSWLDFHARVEIRSKESYPLHSYEFPFAPLIAPFVEEALDELNQQVAPLANLDIRAIFGSEARSTLGKKLFDQASRVLVLEMHAAHARGELHGVTSAERYESFVSQLADDRMSRLLQSYPVLARLLGTTTSDWITAAVEMAQRLYSDAAMLNNWLDSEVSLHTLRRAAWGFGDLHHEGRTGWRLDFASCSLFYKPRSLTIEHAFQQLLEWLNTKEALPHFRTLDIYDRGQYGWVEFLSPQPCVSIDEVERYFHRLGALICLVHLLDGTDCHSTNLFAVGEHPMLIDLEGLFHPRLNQHEVKTAVDAALRMLSASPLRTGLLPVWQWEGADRSGVDISGIGAASHQVLRRSVWEQPYTDMMRLGSETYQMGWRPNHVLFEGKRVQPEQYVDTLIKGFQETWGVLLKHSHELRHASGPLANFFGCQTRLIFQNTATYQTLQDASLHPVFLRSGVQRDVALDRLWITATDDPRYDAFLSSAQKDMWHGDTPYFGAIVGSLDVITSQGVLKEALDASVMDTVLTHIDEMTYELGERYAALIRSSLATLSSRRMPLSKVPFRGVPKNPPDWLDAAHMIGRELLTSAIHYPPGATWTGLTLQQGQWRIRPLASTLYDGLSGVALFLAYLAQLTNDPSIAALCDEALYTLRTQLDETKLAPIGIGAFTGWASLIYLYTHINAIRGERTHQDIIDRCLDQIAKQIELDQAYDWIDGASGCTAVLLGAYQQTGTQIFLDLAVCCGKHLLHSAKSINGGLGWPRPSDAIPLAGLAHGASGIAVALARLFKATGNVAFSEAARGALYYERSIYSSSMRNWPDLRDPTTPSAMTAWCHGAAGIGMARLELASLDEMCTAEAELALSAVHTAGWGREHCLCHGDLGNLDLLLQARHIDEARTIASNILGNQLPSTLKGGAPLHSTTPGLMLGLAGIGFGLLRLAAPAAIPCTLMLAPPITSLVAQHTILTSGNAPLIAKAYCFYGHLQDNFTVIYQLLDIMSKTVFSGKTGVAIEDIVPVYNKTALDFYRAGSLDRASDVCKYLLTILDMLQVTNIAECVTIYRPTCLLNFARLEAAQGNYHQARPYFDMLAKLPDGRWDTLLPEIARCYRAGGAYAEGLAYLAELKQSRNLPYDDSDLLRAQALLYTASDNLYAALGLLTSINLDKLTLIEQCWLLLEQAEISIALKDNAYARSACISVSTALEQLLATSPETASMPLLISLALAKVQAKMEDWEAAVERVRETAARAARNKLEAVFLRSGAILCSLLTATNCRLDDGELKELLSTSRVSRYWLEVMSVWGSIGKNLVYTGRNDGEREAGISYLSRVTLESTQEKPLAVDDVIRNALAELRQCGRDPIGEPWCFADSEPQILSDVFMAVTNLTNTLIGNLHAII